MRVCMPFFVYFRSVVNFVMDLFYSSVADITFRVYARVYACVLCVCLSHENISLV